MLSTVDLKKDKQYTCRCFLAPLVFVIQTWGANPQMSGGCLGEPSGSFALLLEQGAGGLGLGDRKCQNQTQEPCLQLLPANIFRESPATC